MKIKLIVNELNIGGAENQAVIFAKYLSEKKYETELVTMYPGGKYWDLAKKHQLQVASLFSKKSPSKILRLINLLITPLKIRRILNKSRSDVVLYSYSDVINLLAFFSCIFKKKHVKLIWMIRRSNLGGFGSPEWKVYIAEKICGYFSSWVDRVVFNSTAGLKHYTSKLNFNNSNSMVLHNFIETDKFKKEILLREARASYGLNDNAIVIGVFGRIIKDQKGHDVFLKAFALVKSDYPLMQALILGPADETTLQEIKNQAIELNISNDVIFLGARNDMDVMYNLIDIFCSPSLSEGTSNVILEAMASELPCIVTDVGESKYVAGSNNVVVPPGDHYNLSQGIKEMMSMRNSWQEIGVLNRTRMQEIFSKDKAFVTIEKMILEQ